MEWARSAEFSANFIKNGVAHLDVRTRLCWSLVFVCAALAAFEFAGRCAGQDRALPSMLPPTEHLSPPGPLAKPYVRPLEWVLEPFTYTAGGQNPAPWKSFELRTYDSALPIDLSMALLLVNSRSLDVSIAGEQIRKAAAQYDQAKYAWLPTISIGPQYYRHDGPYLHSTGSVTDLPLTFFYTGAAVNAKFTPSDAIYSALAARQVVRSRQADLTATANDVTNLVAQAYFTVQQARGNVAGAEHTVRAAEKLVDRTKGLAKQGLVLPVEEVRARTELARRQQAYDAGLEKWRVASADLTRVLRLDREARIEPAEPPHFQVTLVGLGQGVDDLIPIGLRNRPELASQRALVEAALMRLKAEKIRPLVPSIVLSSPTPTNSSIGYFGAGQNALSDYGWRSDINVQAVWTFENLGLTNVAKIRERKADERAAVLQLFKVQDQVAAEIVQAYAQARSARSRMAAAETGLKDALESVDKNFEGMKQTRVAGELVIMLVRPQEVNAAVQDLATAYADYYGSIADYNRAQFQLFRALGFPPRILTGDEAQLCAPVVAEPQR